MRPGRGLQGLFYWVHKVKDQAERGNAYRYFVENAAAHPAMIGTHWFQSWTIFPPAARRTRSASTMGS